MSDRAFGFYAGWLAVIVALAIIGYMVNAPENPVDTSAVQAAIAAGSSHS